MSIAEGEPVACGKYRSSVFVVSCGELWFFFGLIGVIVVNL